MSKFTHLLTTIKKPLAARPLAALALATTLAAAFGFLGSAADVSAWGPADRPTYTNAKPAPYATFNSITDNAAVGDERNFVRVREAGTNNKYVDELEVVPGKEYEVYIYYHNDAATDTNATGYGMATDARVASAYPTVLNPGERGMISAYLYWSYVMPGDGDRPRAGSVWDEAYLTTKSANTVLKYKTGTAVIHNAGGANGSVLSTRLFTNDGTYIGFNKLTGVLPGCAEYSGYITYTLVAESTTSELTKEVSTDGTTWSNSVTVNAGDYVTYRVTFKNTGNTTMTNVIFKDSHSNGLSIRSGSTKIFDVNHTSGKQIDDILDLSGYNVGNVAPGALVQIIYQARVDSNYTDCASTLSNKISVEYNGKPQQESVTNVAVHCTEIIPEEIENAPCDLDPTLPGCSEAPKPTTPSEDIPEAIPNTGPAEVVLAAVIVLAIVGGGFYLWRTNHVLRTVEDEVSGKSPIKSSGTKSSAAKSTDQPSINQPSANQSSAAKSSPSHNSGTTSTVSNTGHAGSKAASADARSQASRPGAKSSGRPDWPGNSQVL